MKKAQYLRLVSCILSIVLCCLAGFSFVNHKAAADEKNILVDGTYTMQSFLRSASSDQASMGNAGIIQPVQLIVKDGTYTVRAECKALSTKLGTINFTGYLAQMSIFQIGRQRLGKSKHQKMKHRFQSMLNHILKIHMIGITIQRQERILR